MWNPADALTLYRFPVVELQKYGFSEAQKPFLHEPEDSEDEEAVARYHLLRQEWPEEVVFHLGDLVELYKEQAL